ncbi:MAG: glycoside hydrolase family 43 protein [Planctomycetes bacterium]|nr:glycoside hydrolase family 43 protein [Planctomycetota bacterium]
MDAKKLFLLGVAVLVVSSSAACAGQWSPEKAWRWYGRVGTIKGCNYLPRTAVNMTEMWRGETFDPATIDEELGWAEEAGYNSVRVFVQYLVWKDDADGLKKRIEEFLSIADSHGISTMMIFFCDCSFAGKEPYLGKQDDPVPGVHNSGWVPSPGLKRVTDKSVWGDLEKYVKDIVGSFAGDKRILIWDLYNEPGNSRMGEKSLPLAEAAFAWAREVNPLQPVTIGAWSNFNGRMSKRLMELSDVVSFHGYEGPEGIEAKIKICRQYGRPIICTEWLRRQVGNTFASILPVFAANRVGGYHWGLVAGRTQTYMHWGSKKGSPMPKVWQHDVFYPDGKPYDTKEMQLLKAFSFGAAESGGCYVFTYFKGNGEDGLHLAYSTDGFKWTSLNEDKSLLKPTVGGDKLMRDPCVIKGVDGLFHMVWTVSWKEKGIGYANSRDLIHWSKQKHIGVMEHEAGACNCWAPEVFYDEANRQYLIFWATTIPGRFPATEKAGDGGLNHRIYYVTTKDFETFSPMKLFYDDGFNVIDSTIVASGGRYVMFLKDETRDPAQKNIRMAFSDKAEGPYSKATEPITGDYWAEGPTAIKIGEDWIVYFDKYREHRYGAVISKDLKNWRDISEKVSFPDGFRHGTVLAVDRGVLDGLLELTPDEK